MKNKKYCCNCKRLIARGETFCEHCGTDLKKYKIKKTERCVYCNALISSEANFCEHCGTKRENVEEIIKSRFEYTSRFLCERSNCFADKTIVNVFAKNGKIKFATLGNGIEVFNIKNDFLSCEKLSEFQIKGYNLREEVTHLKLMFNDKFIILEYNEVTKFLIKHIYENISYSVYEEDSVFYNTEHHQFSLF